MLAVAAHGGAGGGVPDPSALLLLLGLSSALGLCAASLTRRPVLVVVGLLGLGQLAGHLVLSSLVSVAAHQHTGDTAAPAGGMLGAHAVATVLGAALILLAERVGPWSAAAMRRVLSALRSPVVVAQGAGFVPTVPVRSSALRTLFVSSVSRRGPPVRV